MPSIAYRTCHLCEATCGLELHIDDGEIALVRGDRDDVFSHGYLCPKGTAIKHLEADPDRVRTPMIRRGETWHEVTWDEAFAEIDRRLGEVRTAHGNDSVAAYLGNPNAHNLGPVLYNRVFLQALGSANVYSASTVDQMPKQVSAGLMFGTALSVPVPDIDRTDYLLMLGANPFASNGSLWTAPDLPSAPARRCRARGGRLVVVDPRRTKTAERSRRARRDPAGHRRAVLVRARARALRARTSSRSVRWPSTPKASTRYAPRRISFRPSRSRTQSGSTRTP